MPSRRRVNSQYDLWVSNVLKHSKTVNSWTQHWGKRCANFLVGGFFLHYTSSLSRIGMQLRIPARREFIQCLIAFRRFYRSILVVCQASITITMKDQGGPKTRRFFVSESSNKILRHIRSKTWPEARPAARQKEWVLVEVENRNFFVFWTDIVMVFYTMSIRGLAETLLWHFLQRCCQKRTVWYYFDGKLQTAKRPAMADISHSQKKWRSNSWLWQFLIVW